MKDRIWERLYSIPQKAFSFHASRPVLLLRGLILFAIGLFGVFNHKKVMPLAYAVCDVHEFLE